MEAVVGRKLPPGFRFYPTDEELFMFYLKRKVLGKSLGPQMMSEVDVYRFAPWELPAKACLNKDLNWYFLCPRSKKYPSGGARANRATELGYWKSTGIDRTVTYKNRPVGKIKTLVFHRGKAPKGDRTNWVMHEYRLEDKMLLEQGVPQDSYVICKIYEKSGLGPKNGEHYGAPFVEEEWESDDDNDDTLKSDPGLTLNPEGTQTQPPLPVDVADSPNGSNITATLVGHNPVDPSASYIIPQPPVEPMEGLPPIETEEEELDRLLAIFADSGQLPLTEDEIFSGLDDLGVGSLTSGEDIDWSHCLSENCYLELNDLCD